MTLVFINYRFSDSQDIAARLDDELRKRFGSDHVFLDKSKLRSGSWSEQILAYVRDCDVMLTLIGNDWETASSELPDGKTRLRLCDPDDFVRREISEALRLQKRIIPLRLNGAQIPGKEFLLPLDLNGLVENHAFELRSGDWHHDLEKLIDELRRICPTLRSHEEVEGGASEKRWRPFSLFAIQPAPKFVGREPLCNELHDWCSDERAETRVVSLVAPGGTGKSAIVEKVVSKLIGPNSFGIFEWKFEEDFESDSFFRSALAYLEDESGGDSGGHVSRLMQSLMSSEQAHLFVLDGLESIQSDGSGSHPIGELLDPPMVRFLSWLAVGRDSQAKALVTSRFDLANLSDWEGQRYRAIKLPDLEPDAARNLLRKRGVKGTGLRLDLLAEKYHRHALSLDVLGSFLSENHNGDPNQAPKFDPEQQSGLDIKTFQLYELLKHYRNCMTPKQRDLLSRLSEFTRAVDVQFLVDVFEADPEVAGTLHGCSRDEIADLMTKLCQLGLVSRSKTGDDAEFFTHAFIREFFRQTLDEGAQQKINESVRKILVQSLYTRQINRPTNAFDLDRCEHLIEATRKAGRVSEAVNLFWNRLGGVKHLCWTLGEFSRGMRIISGFSSNNDIRGLDLDIDDHSLSKLVDAWAQFARKLGDLDTARLALHRHQEIIQRSGDIKWLSRGLQHLAGIDIQSARFPDALKRAKAALEQADKADDNVYRSMSHGYIAESYYLLGETDKACKHFTLANSWEQSASQLKFHSGAQEADFKLRMGKLTAARDQSRANRAISKEKKILSVAYSCDVILAHCNLQTDRKDSKRRLTQIREYIDRTGAIDLSLRAHKLASEIERLDGRLEEAWFEASQGAKSADYFKMSRWSLDLRLEQAKAELEASRIDEAIDTAQSVFDHASQPSCQYQWAVGDSLHLLGIAISERGDLENARKHLTHAEIVRSDLKDPQLDETQRRLNALPK